jgi:hypothetical protein
VSHEQALRAALAAEPDLAGATTALRDLLATFAAVKTKADNTDAARDAAEREAVAREEVDHLLALAEIGRTTPEKVDAAREALRVAVDASEAIPRRRDVLLGELHKIRAEIVTSINALTKLMAGWEADVSRAIDAAEVEAVNLLRLAGFASKRLGQYPFAPTSRKHLAGWLDHRTAELPDPAPVAAAPVIEAALSILRDAENVRGIILPAPKPRPELPGHHFHTQHTGPASDPQPVPASVGERPARLW